MFTILILLIDMSDYKKNYTHDIQVYYYRCYILMSWEIKILHPETRFHHEERKYTIPPNKH